MLHASSPALRLSPAFSDTTPTMAGPAEAPASPDIASRPKRAVPPRGILADEMLIVPGHMIATENPQRIHPRRPTAALLDRDSIR